MQDNNTIRDEKRIYSESDWLATTAHTTAGKQNLKGSCATRSQRWFGAVDGLGRTSEDEM